MVTKVFVNNPLRKIPIGGMFRYNNVFYWRGRALRGCGSFRVYTEQSRALRSQLILPCSLLVQYYKES